MTQKYQGQGTVQKVAFSKTFPTRNGECQNVRFTTDGSNWFTIKFVPANEAPNLLQPGVNISFLYTSEQNGEYINNDIIQKDLTIIGGAQQQPQANYQQPQAMQQPVQQQAPPMQQQPMQQPAAQQTQGTGGRPQQPRNGAMIGNALNNAAVLLGAGHSVAELCETARQVLVAAEYLSTCSLEGVSINPPAQVQQQPAQAVQQPPAQTAPQSAPMQQQQQGGIQPQYNAPAQTGQTFDDDIPF